MTLSASIPSSASFPETWEASVREGIGAGRFDCYREWLEVREAECFRESVGEIHHEKHWQLHLYQGRFGSRWVAQDGSPVEVLHFGRMNREAGPDFVHALVRFGKESPFIGDLELDQDVRDWERHGHSRNVNYRKVRVHFFFKKPAECAVFTRNVDGEHIHQVLLDPGHTHPSFSLARPSVFSTVDSREIMKLIKAAARFRMFGKQEAFRRRVVLVGFTEALFQGIAAVLGYRPNSLPFDLLARRVGLEAAASSSGEALLFGVAGFLRGEEFMRVPEEGRGYLRHLWDLWWPYRDRLADKQLPSQLWRRTSIRPLNYPERRLGALTLIARQFLTLQTLIRSGDAAAFVNFLMSLHHHFWQIHFSFFSKSKSECHLLGKERALDLLINVFYPAQDFEDPAVWSRFQQIRLPTIPRKVSETFSTLVGDDHLPRICLKNAVVQQGLLQMASHLHRFEAPFSELKTL